MKEVLFLAFCFLITVNVYPQLATSQRGNVIGLGFAHYSVTTSWYYYDATGIYKDRYPWHNFSRQLFMFYFDVRSLFNIGKVNADLTNEIQFGFMGDTKEDWITDDKETISDGGMSGAFASILRF